MNFEIFFNFRNELAQHSLNYRGWQTDRKIVVFESDDWGSIRMPSLEVYRKLLTAGVPVDNSPYCKYDSLASEEDMISLFEILNKYKDSKGRKPVITANTVSVNPDFEKIHASNFNEYHYEKITETFQRYPKHSKCFNLWEEGIRNGLFFPQSHGREHLNVPLWLELLKSKEKDFLLAFENNFWGLSCDVFPKMKRSIQASFDLTNENEMEFHRESVRDGLDIFEELFGYRSLSFIPNNFIWKSELNKTLQESGIKYLQGMKYQKLPLNNKRKRKLIRHYVGENNSLNQIHLIRNCFFEPSLNSNKTDCVENCLSGISNAFLWKKPAMISVHRINFVGYLDENNRNQNLILFKKLLNEMLKKWPQIEFMTNVELGQIIEKDYKVQNKV